MRSSWLGGRRTVERDAPEAVIAAYLMAAPEQGDWGWAAHCDGMAGGLIDALDAHGYSVHGPEADDTANLIAEGINAFQFTRDYVGQDVLPPVEGWSWFDWTQRAQAWLARRAREEQP